MDRARGGDPLPAALAADATLVGSRSGGASPGESGQARRRAGLRIEVTECDPGRPTWTDDRPRTAHLGTRRRRNAVQQSWHPCLPQGWRLGRLSRAAVAEYVFARSGSVAVRPGRADPPADLPGRAAPPRPARRPALDRA